MGRFGQPARLVSALDVSNRGPQATWTVYRPCRPASSSWCLCLGRALDFRDDGASDGDAEFCALLNIIRYVVRT